MLTCEGAQGATAPEDFVPRTAPLALLGETVVSVLRFARPARPDAADEALLTAGCDVLGGAWALEVKTLPTTATSTAPPTAMSKGSA